MDIVWPWTEILRNNSIEITVDLAYAKGFAWIKYQPGSFGLDLSQQPSDLIVKHDDGNSYLN